MLRLADTSVRIYRKRDGRLSLKLRSYLMVPTNAGFRLSAYLRSVSGCLEFPGGESVEIDTIAHTEDCAYEMGHMIHEFWASAVTDLPVSRYKAAKLTIDYHLSFTGRPTELPSSIELVVPLVNRTR
jgi:hypothetical protein